MNAGLAVLGILGCAGCASVSEETVRDKAASDFSCASFELTVVEVGPDVYRAAGCGQELIYACRATRSSPRRAPDAPAEPVVCARTPE